jgi:hypothetical protein
MDLPGQALKQTKKKLLALMLPAASLPPASAMPGNGRGLRGWRRRRCLAERTLWPAHGNQARCCSRVSGGIAGHARETSIRMGAYEAAHP